MGSYGEKRKKSNEEYYLSSHPNLPVFLIFSHMYSSYQLIISSNRIRGFADYLKSWETVLFYHELPRALLSGF